MEFEIGANGTRFADNLHGGFHHPQARQNRPTTTAARIGQEWSATKLLARVRRSLTLMSAHPAVSKVGDPVVDETTQIAAVDVTFDVSLPSEWQRRGESPSGVRAKEVVRFDFPSAFPLGRT